MIVNSKLKIQMPRAEACAASLFLRKRADVKQAQRFCVPESVYASEWLSSQPVHERSVLLSGVRPRLSAHATNPSFRDFLHHLHVRVTSAHAEFAMFVNAQ